MIVPLYENQVIFSGLDSLCISDVKSTDAILKSSYSNLYAFSNDIELLDKGVDYLITNNVQFPERTAFLSKEIVETDCKALFIQYDGTYEDFIKNVTKKPFHILVQFQYLISISQVAELHGLGIDCVLKLSDIGFREYDKAGVNIGDYIAACLISDRIDGLFPTIVTDEYNKSLGLAYSNAQSIHESIRLTQGVYCSRKRGIWYKGETSGNSQILIRLSIDCDNDTLLMSVKQKGPGFCHLNTTTCFGNDFGLSQLERTIYNRITNSIDNKSYTHKLLNDNAFLSSKIKEEAQELVDANNKNDIAFEAADLFYFALTKCAKYGVTLSDIEANLNVKSKKITRRPGLAKDFSVTATNEYLGTEYRMQFLKFSGFDDDLYKQALKRATIPDVSKKVLPIMNKVVKGGDAALIELTNQFDGVLLQQTVLKAPFDKSYVDAVPENVKNAIDAAYSNIKKFHDAQLTEDLHVETSKGVFCSRKAVAIEKVGLYIPGGSAVLPSTALMLGVPAQSAGCSTIVFATPPCKSGPFIGKPSPEIVYVANKVGATHILLAGGAQAISALAYGTASCPKVFKICGPGNQWVTAAKCVVQSDMAACVSIDMPAGPSEVMVICDNKSNMAFVASDLLSQAEHGPDSQVICIGIDLSQDRVDDLTNEINKQAALLPRKEIIAKSLIHSTLLIVKNEDLALQIINEYAPEHLILQIENCKKMAELVINAGSIFIGKYTPESCGDYASGTNHTLPTHGFAKMYGGVSTNTFIKYITLQEITKEGLKGLGPTVMTLAKVEELDAHHNAVAIRLSE